MPRKKQFDRTIVLEKAMELFWNKGFHATSIQDLVDHCGINRASMYDTFGGKEQLFKEAFQLYRDQEGEYFKATDQQLAKKSVRQFLEGYFYEALKEIQKDHQNKGCMVVNTTTELCNQNKEILQLVKTNLIEVVQLFSHIIAIGQKRQEIGADHNPVDLAYHLFTFYNGFKVIAKIEQDPRVLKTLIDQELDYIFQA